MKTTFNALLALFLALLVSACSTLSEIRDVHMPVQLHPGEVPHTLAQCDSGHAVAEDTPGAHNSIEDYGQYLIAYTEFDDQGWNTGHTGTQGQVQALMDALDTEIAGAPDILIMVFVHGWHHNAYTNDCNVSEFRAMVRLTSDALAARGTPRKVVGVYVGWRGESLTVPGLRYGTIYTRKLAAEHVAKGSVRELFARLKLFETEHRKSAADTRVRTVIIGHSFGGLIAYHSLSQSLLEDVVFGARTCEKQRAQGRLDVRVQTAHKADAEKWEYPDLVVLINPAFEASRYEALYQSSVLPPECAWGGRKRPRLLTLAADNDMPTGTFFPLVRRMATVFEQYNDLHRGDEQQANLNVVGFVDRYRTHRLKRCPVNGKEQIVMSEDFGGPARDPNGPLIVARATPDVLYGHDGFLYSPTSGALTPALFEFLTTFYMDGQAMVATRCDG